MKYKIFLLILLCIHFDAINSQNYVWAKKVSSNGIDQPQSIATDRFSNVYTIGYFQDTCDFDPGPGTYTMAPASAFDTFILKLDSSGNFIWAIKIGGVGFLSNWHQTASITIDSLNNIYATGFFGGTVDMDPGPGTFTLTQTGLHDIFVCKLNSAGALIWAKQFGSRGYEQSFSLSLDPSYNILTTGTFADTVDFDPGPGYSPLIASNNSNCFISKLDNNGNFIWAKAFAGNAEGHCIVSDTQGDIFCTGTFFGLTDFDPSSGFYPLVSGSNSTAEVFITKLNSFGSLLWAKKFGGIDSPDDGTQVALDNQGNIYLGGVFTGNADFDPGPGTYTVSSYAGFEDAYLLKLNSAGNFVWFKQFGGTDYESLYSICLDGASNIYLSGGFISANVDFDPGPGTFTMTPNGGFVPGQGDIFLVKLTSNGAFSWAVQLGGKGPDGANAMAVDQIGNVYNAGTYSADQFSDFDPGSGQYFMPSQISWPEDGYVVRLSKNCYKPAQPVANPPLNLCLGNTATISASSSGGISWYTSPTATMPLSNSATLLVNTGLSGTQTFFAEARGCVNNPNRTQITITVNALPNVAVSCSPSPFCQGDFPVITAFGAQTFSWQSGSQTNSIQISPPYLSSYSVSGFDSLGCQKRISFTPTINVCDALNEIFQSHLQAQAFPNPVNEILNISISGQVNGVINAMLFDQFGRKLKELEMSYFNGTLTLDTSDLMCGLYFLKLGNIPDLTTRVKFMVAR